MTINSSIKFISCRRPSGTTRTARSRGLVLGCPSNRSRHRQTSRSPGCHIGEPRDARHNWDKAFSRPCHLTRAAIATIKPKKPKTGPAMMYRL